MTADRTFPLQKEFQEYLIGLCGRTDGLNKFFIAAVLSIYRHQLVFVSQANIDDINRTQGIKDDDTRIDYGRLFRARSSWSTWCLRTRTRCRATTPWP